MKKADYSYLYITDIKPNICDGPGYTKAVRDDETSICYFLYKDEPPNYAYNFDDAKAYCEDKGMVMVDIKGPKDNSNVYDILVEGGEKSVLLGAKTIPPPKSNGQFVWPDGSLVSYFNWLHGEPGLPDTHHCIQILPNEDGKWRDAICHLKRTTIMCQFHFSPTNLE